MTYSLDFRQHVQKVKAEESLTYEQTASRFKIGIASLVRWNRNLEPKASRNKPATKIDMEQLKEDVLLHPDSYQYERAQRLQVSKSGIHFALKRLGISYKKNFKSSKSR